MIVASLILILSTAMFLFYMQATCQNILSRHFDHEYFQSIVHANRLEFPSVRKALRDYDSSVDYSRFRMTLKCDFLALTYLLKNAGNAPQRYTREERMLLWYFRVVYVVMIVVHALRLREDRALLNLTSILQYFANVVGQRVNHLRFGEMSASDILLSL